MSKLAGKIINGVKCQIVIAQLSKEVPSVPFLNQKTKQIENTS